MRRPQHPKNMASQRKRLGPSPAECGLLIGASAQFCLRLGEGKARPRAQHLPANFALRNLGRRQANEILETRKAASRAYRPTPSSKRRVAGAVLITRRSRRPSITKFARPGTGFEPEQDRSVARPS